jgi:peptidoglycan/LPS O-acetylase OafA/YrhL
LITVRDRFAAGDPLRAIAAIMVLTGHALLVSTVAGGSELDKDELELGFYGVTIFFVLSGYLISRPFVQAFIADASAPQLGAYVRNRLLRIVPAFWVIATLVIVRVELFGGFGSDNNTIADILTIYAFAQVFSESEVIQWQLGPAWTLHCEMAFYLSVPVVAFLLGRLVKRRFGPRGRLWVVLAAAAAVVAGSLVAVDSSLGRDGFALSRALYFMPGVALAALEPFARVRAPRLPRIGVAAPTLVGLGAVLLVAAPNEGSSPVLRSLMGAAGCGAIVAGPLLWQWSGRPGWRFLVNRPLAWLGERSYAIYLLHMVVISELLLLVPDGPWDSFPALWAATFVLTVAGAALSWRFVEEPFLRLRSRPAETGSGRAAPPLAGVPASEGGVLQPLEQVDRRGVHAGERRQVHADQVAEQHE